ncbi:MAG: hypothetical protein P1U40_05170 [Coxiellaceae bacterium]|nr:hypothetical protein [Coxiellaceae bacterium]
MTTVTAVGGEEFKIHTAEARDDSPSSESLSSDSATPSPSSQLLPPDEQQDAEVAALFSPRPKWYGTNTDPTDYPDNNSVLSDCENTELLRTDSVTSMDSIGSGYDSAVEPILLSSSSSHSSCTRKKALEYSLAFLVVGIRMAGKVLKTYYGAKVFIQHSPFIESIAGLAWITQNIIPAITGVQNYFMGGSSGHKIVKALIRTPGLECGALKKGLHKHPFLSSLVFLRLAGDAVFRVSVIHNILLAKCGSTPTWLIAVSIAGLNALCDIKFTAASDFRLLKRLSSWLCCSGVQPIDIPLGKRAGVLNILAEKTTIDNRLSLDHALSDLSDCAIIRHYVRTAEFQRAYFGDNLHPSPAEKWHFTRIKNELVERASRYHWRVELSARLTSLAVNLPFLYLAFIKNKTFVDQFAGSQVAYTWGVVSCMLMTLTSQGKTVEGLSDSYASLGTKTYGRVKRVAYEKPYALLFYCLDILPFSIFGVGQILDMPHKLPWLGDDGAKAFLVVFAVTQLISYCCFVAPRVTKRMPSCFWVQKKAATDFDYASLDNFSRLESPLPVFDSSQSV